MPVSEIPLLKGDAVTIATNDLNDYKLLLRVQCDPNRVIYIRDIIFTLDDTTSLPQIKVSVNGETYLEDFPLLVSSGGVGFGGDLKSIDTKDPLKVWVKKTNAGAGALTITCLVNGVQLKK